MSVRSALRVRAARAAGRRRRDPISLAACRLSSAAERLSGSVITALGQRLVPSGSIDVRLAVVGTGYPVERAVVPILGAGRGRRTGYGVGNIVMSIWRMIDTVLAAAASAPFQTADLRHQPIMARQDNLAAVEAWQQVPIEITLRLLAQFVGDAVLVEWLLHELAAVVVTNHFGNAVGLEQVGEFVNDDGRTEWRPHFADSVNNNPIVRPRLVRDRQRHSVRATAASQVDESAIAGAARRQLLAVVTHATSVKEKRERKEKRVYRECTGVRFHLAACAFSPHRPMRLTSPFQPVGR